MITYDDLVRPLSEGGHYEFNRLGIHQFLALLRDTDHALLYQNHMLDSPNVGKSSLMVAGPGRTFSADDPPKQIGDVPSRFQQLEGEVDIASLRTGMMGYEPPSNHKCIGIVGNDVGGDLLWRVYQLGLEHKAYVGRRGQMSHLQGRGLVEYSKRQRGWVLTQEGWEKVTG